MAIDETQFGNNSNPSQSDGAHLNLAPAKSRKILLLHVESLKKLFRLDKERVVVGSVESADVRLTGEGIAPIHAVIELNYDPENDTYSPSIYDLASDAGTLVNGARAVTQSLKSGDTITIGKVQLKFELQDLSTIPKSPLIQDAEGRKLFMDSDEDLKPLLLESDHNIEDIFDYRPAQKQALEVIMSWHGTILDVEHFVDDREVTLGTSRAADFPIPNSSPKFPLVSRSGAEYALNLDSQMKGVIQRKGTITSIDELRSQMASMGSALPLHKDDFAKVSFGEVDLYLSFTAAPPRLKRSRMLDKDPLFAKIFWTSMLFTAAIIAGLMQLKVPDQLDAEQIPDKVATVLYQPEIYTYKQDKTKVVEEKEKVVTPKPTPTPTKTVKMELHPHVNPPKEVPKEMVVAPHNEVKPTKTVSKTKSPAKTPAASSQHEAKEGEGRRAKGEEGTRGSKTSTNTTAPPQNKLTRVAPGAGGGAAGASQVPDEGNLDVFKDAVTKVSGILGSSGGKMKGGGARNSGYGDFTTAGGGGLALSGTGKGGGGDADTTLGGLGNKGHGGGRVGTGMGAAGNGNGIAGGSKVSIRSGGSEEAVVMGTIDADAVEAALLAHKDEFRLCYEREINAENPNLAGRVGTTFTIGASGRVTAAGIESSTLHSPNAEGCIIKVLKRIDFPIPRGAGVVQVSYPFKFSPVGR